MPQDKVKNYSRAFRRLKQDKTALFCLTVICLYIAAALLAQAGVIAAGYNQKAGEAYLPPNLEFPAGTDVLGRDVLQRIVQGSKVAMLIGFVATLIAIPIGIVLGSLSGYFRGKVDDFIVWFYTTFDSIPPILMLIALTFVMGKGLIPICIALGITSWVSTCRIVRGEYIKQRELEYVQAVRALGASPFRIMYRHILPNAFHLVLIQASLIFVFAIKSEVILSYLGLGDASTSSWGIMISDARLELVGRGVWWSFAGATTAMFILLLAFNMFNDALRDALDPKSRVK